jgi:dihydrofolate reductase
VGKVFVDITMSLDGFVAGPRASQDEPLGHGGERLHEWAVPLEPFRRRHGGDGGVVNEDCEVLEESVRGTAATIMGRKMFSGGDGPWEDDTNSSGWWGDDPPYHHPVFVLTHHPREPLVMEGGTTFTFVTEGVDAAMAQARAAAGDGNVIVAGGGAVVQQFLQAGLIEEIQVHVAPVLLGDGVRLFGPLPADGPFGLEPDRVLGSPAGVAHLRYRIPR